MRTAGERLRKEGIAEPIILGEGGLSPSRDPRLGRIATYLRERRPDEIRDGVHALDIAADPATFGAALVALGEAEGAVAGAVLTTREVLRAALWGIGTAPGIKQVSSSFYMVFPSDLVLTFTDCAVVPEPTAEELAGIALAAARDRTRLVGDSPRVAFLSYSTKGSADGPRVRRIREAAALFRTLAPGIPSDGELQGDAALVADVAERKAPGSPVAGKRERAGVSRSRRRQHRLQADPAAGRRGGHRPHPAGTGAADGRPVAGGHGRRYCRGGGDGGTSERYDDLTERPMGFNQTKDQSGVAVVQVEGQLIVGNRQELKDLVQAALDSGERRLLIDFSQTGYIDSSGLGALVSISKRIREAGGDLRLSGLNEDLRSLFELTKLDTLFAIADTPQQALASF